MRTTINCPNCGATYDASGLQHADRFSCSSCGQLVVYEAPASVAAPPLLPVHPAQQDCSATVSSPYVYRRKWLSPEARARHRSPGMVMFLTLLTFGWYSNWWTGRVLKETPRHKGLMLKGGTVNLHGHIAGILSLALIAGGIFGVVYAQTDDNWAFKAKEEAHLRANPTPDWVGVEFHAPTDLTIQQAEEYRQALYDYYSSDYVDIYPSRERESEGGVIVVTRKFDDAWTTEERVTFNNIKPELELVESKDSSPNFKRALFRYEDPTDEIVWSADDETEKAKHLQLNVGSICAIVLGGLMMLYSGIWVIVGMFQIHGRMTNHAKDHGWQTGGGNFALLLTAVISPLVLQVFAIPIAIVCFALWQRNIQRELNRLNDFV